MLERRASRSRVALLATVAFGVAVLAGCGFGDEGADVAANPPPVSGAETAEAETVPETATETTRPADPALALLGEMRERWRTEGPVSYRLWVYVGCDCPRTETGPFVVSVDESGVQVAYAADGPEGEPPASASELTVEGLFDRLEHAIEASPTAQAEVEYDEATGLPSRAFVFDESDPESQLNLDARLLADTADPELAAARERWEALDLTRYTIELRHSCFCPPEYVGPFLVTVDDGRVEKVEFGAGGPTGKPPKDAPVVSVERLFDRIEEAKAGGAAEVRVTYDPGTGLPTQVYIDQIAEAIDEEVSYDVRLVEPAS
jgi:hypothetical protein